MVSVSVFFLFDDDSHITWKYDSIHNGMPLIYSWLLIWFFFEINYKKFSLILSGNERKEGPTWKVGVSVNILQDQAVIFFDFTGFLVHGQLFNSTAWFSKGNPKSTQHPKSFHYEKWIRSDVLHHSNDFHIFFNYFIRKLFDAYLSKMNKKSLYVAAKKHILMRVATKNWL